MYRVRDIYIPTKLCRAEPRYHLVSDIRVIFQEVYLEFTTWQLSILEEFVMIRETMASLYRHDYATLTPSNLRIIAMRASSDTSRRYMVSLLYEECVENLI